MTGVTADLPQGCAECERLREEIADYLGHRTDNVAGKVWAAQLLLSRFEERLDDLLGEFDGLGHDDYDQSLEIYGAPDETRLGEEAQRLIRDAGFSQVWLNHGPKGDRSRWETHYTLANRELPVRGWRKRMVAETPDSGYVEISYWPEGWGDRLKAELESGYYRIVPDPLDPFEQSPDKQPV